MLDALQNTRASAAEKSLSERLAGVDLVQRYGRVHDAFGTVLRVSGIDARIGQIVRIHDPQSNADLRAEVVGIKDGLLELAPLGKLVGITSQARVSLSENSLHVPVGNQLLGRVLDFLGRPMDQYGALDANIQRRALFSDSPDPLRRNRIVRPFQTGVRAIDGITTMGEGQRVGIMAAAGVGKSTLLGMIAQQSNADVNVIALIGERGREVREFIEDSLGNLGLARSVVVVSTADRPALERVRAAYAATAIAEGFRAQGKRVLLMMDSVTRFARALRDIGLSVGEPPVRRGFTPSVFAELPRLFERVGNDEHGSITGIYTVLTEDEQTADPIEEEVRSLLDGHLVLTRKLANVGHFPAIDVLRSSSRVMHQVVNADHLRQAVRIRSLLAKHDDIEFLLQIGEYKPGSDPLADAAISSRPWIQSFLRQEVSQSSPFNDTAEQLLGAAL